jgi:hypothetical protein
LSPAWQNTRVLDGLAYAIIAAALVLAAWGGLLAALDRAPDRWLTVGIAAVEALVAAQAVIALVHGGGDALFIGYLASAVLLPPAGWALARMEPTRWGSGIVGAAGLILAPLTLRLMQVWHG